MSIWIPLAAVAAGGLFLGKDALAGELAARRDSFTRWDDLFKRYAALEGIPWAMAKAVCMNESSLGDAKSVARGLEAPNDIEGSKSYDGKSWGLMQITIPTLRDMDGSGTAQKLNDPIYSIKFGCKYLGMLARMFPNQEEWIVKSYNQGPGNSRKEMRGERPARYADVQEYWARYQRNRALIRSKQGV